MHAIAVHYTLVNQPLEQYIIFCEQLQDEPENIPVAAE